MILEHDNVSQSKISDICKYSAESNYITSGLLRNFKLSIVFTVSGNTNAFQ